ncbi:MAG: pyrroline-5-carboxylate reductase [Henriciella sp.]|uniref:pyrroline-5-carboxylate reductase n=1 Tax=Henriciella sp. TaxID=1968823 RepID=UPI000C1113C0|nr:pyrroline-5-carboxylate reductase [Henriciella sp.]MAN74387.1 pyrroline-5-carboxylate reductase [Henriciella sp.]MBF34947.1 pyrroline-5-carboxylate reductase [Hyphomonadaceae bacterium]MBK74530.1 pyrroline-5-carboxylate reductase [Henriciella sp.]PHR77249.1 MAG: pyrroline-5-carboxylate reductase [Henriciella sp.]|tara:strand:- start:3035 stop:3841 length:807 start_codon:yes stop_codon:yes gene_type:complete
MARPESGLTLVGGGRMGSALAGGWIKSGYEGAISIHDPAPSDLLKGWAEAGKIHLNPAPAPANTLVVAVKPQIFPKILDDLRAFVGKDTLVLSIMAGITLDSLAERLGTGRVARAMPNTPGLVGEGMTLLCLPSSASDEDAAHLRDLLTPLGAVEGPIPEDKISAATALSGCGPAYAFLLAEVMAAAGEAHGLDRDLALRLAQKTVQGAGALMMDSDEPPSTLRENVTSPGGVTKAALDVLMRDGAMPSLMKEAVAEAIKRDRELSGD